MSFSPRVASFACLALVAVNAFAPPAHLMSAASRSAPVTSMAPLDAAPAVEAVSTLSQLPTQLVSLEVTTAAFLAVLLGTFFPCFFLITLYIQSEGYKAGNPEEF
ncbi:hypothetical protein CTAYLR_008617 [Chrysophaeum taylorii]|uniref:Uncharacterized protein n=1 Tax=Chrysophaeum taylorii TaxID=2483200 RepID=A0AAD7UI61_9STRA|nr:hypothetical protein CTAYLR_008617 [Chrysophaeum taylorii]